MVGIDYLGYLYFQFWSSLCSLANLYISGRYTLNSANFESTGSYKPEYLQFQYKPSELNRHRTGGGLHMGLEMDFATFYPSQDRGSTHLQPDVPSLALCYPRYRINSLGKKESLL